MAPTPKTTKEELIVENAILKHNEQVRSMLKQELAPFSEAIKDLDKRVTKLEDDSRYIRDIMEPFSNIRKKLWFILIAISLVSAFASDRIINFFTK